MRPNFCIVACGLDSWRFILPAIVFLVGLACAGCRDTDSVQVSTRRPMGQMVSTTRSQHPIEPLTTADVTINSQVLLGRDLFHDPRLSHDNTVSCSTCHDVRSGGDDGRRSSIGIDGAEGNINSPTVLNATLSLAQFWNGRASSLAAQVAGPIHDAKEMGSSWQEVVTKLSADPQLCSRFQSVFGEGINAETITRAIVSYEENLVTPNSPFDRFLLGDSDAIDDEVRAGYALFREIGCASCHQGKGIGGNLFEQLGVMQDFFGAEQPERADPHSAGRIQVTSRASDLHRFKVPTLRNVALTAPYLHDGSAATLEDAVRVMSVYQLGCELTTDELHVLVKFLGSLTGELNEALK